LGNALFGINSSHPFPISPPLQRNSTRFKHICQQTLIYQNYSFQHFYDHIKSFIYSRQQYASLASSSFGSLC
jgi:hypothetical protein